MSYDDGWAAINLRMPKRIPRTEYSIDVYHWPMIRKVTGLDVNELSTPEEKRKARKEFVKKWNYDFMWNTYIEHSELGVYQTDMGHANYSADGSDKEDAKPALFSDPLDILAFQPMEKLGRKDIDTLAARFQNNYDQHCDYFPDCVNMTGTYITLVSGLLALFGWDMMLLALGTDDDEFGLLANRYTEWILQYYQALAETTVPLIMVHDDICWTTGPFISPDWYRKYIFPNYKKLFKPLKKAGKKICYTSDGNYSMFIDDLVSLGINGFVLEPTTDMDYLAKHYGDSHFFIGNADTRILLQGTKEEIRDEVDRCIDIGKNCPGYFMAVGNHIPANTPIENVEFYNMCYEEMMWR